MSLRAAALDDPQALRQADGELLSLALIDARNLTLRWLEVFERRGLDGEAGPGAPAHGPSPRWLAGHAGWYQDHWIGRHVQRSRGPQCDPSSARLASAEPMADLWFAGAGAQPPNADAVRDYLGLTLDTTLELLATLPARPDDNALHFFRAALVHEDRLAEALAERAAQWQLAAEPEPPPPWRPLAGRPDREALWMPEQRVALGADGGGWHSDIEGPAQPAEAVPAFEIDAQAVSWARFIEFAEDGGYDRPDVWTPDGWAWVQAQGRRAPRDVEQLRGAVLLQRQGQLQRAPLNQPVLHCTRHEAQAWCRWAGRRLPTEPEWELAARDGRSRGFVWGDVFEWVAGTARPWPGQVATPGTLDTLPAPGPHGAPGVMRGASFMTAPRQAHAKARRFAAPDDDTPFCGFRSCAL